MLLKFGKHKGSSVFIACSKDLPYMLDVFDKLKRNMANINIKLEIIDYIEETFINEGKTFKDWTKKYLVFKDKFDHRNLKNYNKNNKRGE